MRVGIDIRALMEGKTTGVEVYLINLLNSLFATDKQNEYVLFANSFKKIALPEFNYPNVKVVVTNYPNKFFNLAQKFLNYPKVDKLLGGVDLFFSPHWRITALSPQVPLVVTFHDLFFEIMPEFFTWRRRLWHAFMNYRDAASKAKKIIAVSESTKNDLVKIYGAASDKINVIYSGVNGGNGRNGGNGTYFLYLGTFEPRKNIEAVLAAYQDYYQTSDVKRRLILAGSAGWKTIVRIPRELADKIEIKNAVSEQEKAALYHNAFALVFPSFYEGFGFPVLEAASAGVPVITGFNSALSEIAKDFALFANPLRPSTIAGAMLQLETDNELYDSLRGRGQAAAENYKWQTAAEKTLRLFQEAVA